MNNVQSGDLSTKAHRQHIAYLVDKALDIDWVGMSG
jgi:hypothetical protein